MNWFQKTNDTDSESKKVIVYYEVEPIFRKSGDKIPIGTRIFAFRDTDTSAQVNNFISQNKEKDEFTITLPYHIFIPNYMECNGAEKDSDIIKAFKKFYAGNKEVRATISKWYSNQNTANTK